MSIYHFLQLQPVEPSDDGTVSPLDEYEADETIDLNDDISEEVLDQAWDAVLNDPDDKITFSEE